MAKVLSQKKITELIDIGKNWFEKRGWKAQPFQLETWKAYLNGKSGIVNAPTGSGKTYAMWMPVILQQLAKTKRTKGIKAIWITPLRALSQEINQSTSLLSTDLITDFTTGIRTGDTKSQEKQRQKKNMPDLLITTPESLHILFAQKNYASLFKSLDTVIVDEWHELMGSKRGVQTEIVLSRLRAIRPQLQTWGISATIGNMEEALATLMGTEEATKAAVMVRSKRRKKYQITSIIPEEIETYPWAGHLGIKLAHQVIPIVESSRTTLLFTNTRAQCELWYQRLLEIAPQFAGQMAMHHGSISKELRTWVEQALHEEKLKLVICTSSLDLGVDFHPVDTVIQVGSPKGVARFAQRAGRSGHRPGEKSKIYFLPTHSLELIEAAALRDAINNDEIESRPPYIRCFDVLVQYLVTLAVSDGFEPWEIYNEIKQTYCYESISRSEYQWALNFITTGGDSLYAYDEFKKVEITNEGLYQVLDRRIALRHRLSIGTIVSDTNLQVKLMKGKRLGTIEEYFISKLRIGDVFWFAGRNLALVKIKDMTVFVKLSGKKTGKTPSWAGGRMPLSSQLTHQIKLNLASFGTSQNTHPELKAISPILARQQLDSLVPNENQFLIEVFSTREGYHLCAYPFEGRFVNEAIASLVAYRIAEEKPISFSIAFNDYGFELVSDQPIPLYEALEIDLFRYDDLYNDLQKALNSTELAKRKFRDIASIAGLVFQGFPGKYIKQKHIQSSSQTFFDVFRDYDPQNLLLKQAYEEVFEYQLEEARFQKALKSIGEKEIVVKETLKPTPFSFPIMVDRLREKLSTEKLEDRIKKMTLRLNK